MCFGQGHTDNMGNMDALATVGADLMISKFEGKSLYPQEYLYVEKLLYMLQHVPCVGRTVVVRCASV